jgi:SPP1 family predicted phage head-tail adaptor
VTKYSASDLRHNIEFLRLVRVADGGGGRTNQWLPLSPPVKLDAMIRPRTSRERFMAGQTASAELVLIVIRYVDGIHGDMRIQYGSKVFEILGLIDVDERHDWLEIDAEQKFAE